MTEGLTVICYSSIGLFSGSLSSTILTGRTTSLIYECSLSITLFQNDILLNSVLDEIIYKLTFENRDLSSVRICQYFLAILSYFEQMCLEAVNFQNFGQLIIIFKHLSTQKSKRDRKLHKNQSTACFWKQTKRLQNLNEKEGLA